MDLLSKLLGSTDALSALQQTVLSDVGHTDELALLVITFLQCEIGRSPVLIFHDETIVCLRFLYRGGEGDEELFVVITLLMLERELFPVINLVVMGCIDVEKHILEHVQRFCKELGDVKAAVIVSDHPWQKLLFKSVVVHMLMLLFDDLFH